MYKKLTFKNIYRPALKDSVIGAATFSAAERKKKKRMTKKTKAMKQS